MKHSNSGSCVFRTAGAVLPIIFCATLLLPVAGAQNYLGDESAPVGSPPSPLPVPAVETRRQEAPARPLAELSAMELARLEAMLTVEVQRTVDLQTRVPGQDPIITTRVHYNRATDEVDIDLGSGYIPRGAATLTQDISEQLREVSNTVYDLLDGVFTYQATNELFDGKEVSDIFDEFKKPAQGNKNYRR